MPDDRLAALELLFWEAKDYVRYQFETVQDLEDKAGQIIRFDAVVAGLVVAALSVFLQNGSVALGSFDAALFAASLGALVTSMVFAVLAFVRSDLATGLREDTLKAAPAYRLAEEDLLEEVIPAYADGIRQNDQQVIARTGRQVNAAAALLLGSVGLLAVEATRLLLVVTHG